MVEAARRRRILGLALPIIGGMVSQNVLNLVDTAMVGSLGDNALAGVGLGSFTNFMAVAFVMGMSSAVQAMSARRKGEGRLTDMAVPLNGGLLLAGAIAVPASVVLIFTAPFYFPALAPDAQVAAIGGDYLQLRLIGMAAVGLNFAFRGYWNAVDRSRVYLRTLLVMHAVNIPLSAALIFGYAGLPEMGAPGAGLGTALATWIGFFYYIYLGRKHASAAGFMRELPDRETLSTMLRLAIPAGLQQFFFAAGMTVFFKIVGMVGKQELAASTVLVNLLLVAILPGIAFGIAAATLVGQSLGKGDRAAARAWGQDVLKLGILVLMVIALPAAIAPQWALSAFIHNPETLAIATPAMRLIAISLPLDVVGMVLLNCLLGAGDSRIVMIISIASQWAVQLPLVYLLGPYLGLGLTVIWAGWMAARGLQSVAFWIIWSGDSWGEQKV